MPPKIDVRAIRVKARLSQDRFASVYGFSGHQLRQWEQGRVRPVGAMRAYLMLIDRDPYAILTFLHSADAGKNHDGKAAA